jgi:hypothetical protein
MEEEGRWNAELFALIRATGHLCLQVDNPGWENARGYLFDESGMTLYFAVAKKYLTPPLSQYEVLILSHPKVVARGELQPATSEEDTATQFRSHAPLVWKRTRPATCCWTSALRKLEGPGTSSSSAISPGPMRSPPSSAAGRPYCRLAASRALCRSPGVRRSVTIRRSSSLLGDVQSGRPA